MCLSVLQLFDDEVLNIYNTVKAKYEAMGPDKYKRFIILKVFARWQVILQMSIMLI